MTTPTTTDTTATPPAATTGGTSADAPSQSASGSAITAPLAPVAPDAGGNVKLRDVPMTAEQQMRVYERQQSQRYAAAIKGATWSKEIDANAVRWIAAWAYENDVEPVQEINVLGGNVYINARYYERKLGELVALGLVSHWTREWVHADKRLEELAEKHKAAEAIDMLARRRWARIQHGIPEEATYACVFSIFYKGLDEPSIGVKFFVPGRRKDPVGEASPNETIETRACRRSMLKLRAAFPPGFRMVRRDEDEGVELAQIVTEGHARVKADREVEASLGHKPLVQLNAGDPEDPYAVKPTPARETVPVSLEAELSAMESKPRPAADVSDDEIRRQDQRTLELDRLAEQARTLADNSRRR